MRTAEVKVYTFNELTPDVQKKVIERYQQYAYEDTQTWFDDMREDAKDSAKFLIESLSDNPVECKGVFLFDAETTANAILANHGEVCDTYTDAKDFLAAWNELRDRLAKLHEDRDAVTAKEYSREWHAIHEADELQIIDGQIDALELEIEDIENDYAHNVEFQYARLWSKEVEYQTRCNYDPRNPDYRLIVGLDPDDEIPTPRHNHSDGKSPCF